MPPFKLRIACTECKWERAGYFPVILDKGDTHGDKRQHDLIAYRMDGSIFCRLYSLTKSHALISEEP